MHMHTSYARMLTYRSCARGRGVVREVTRDQVLFVCVCAAVAESLCVLRLFWALYITHMHTYTHTHKDLATSAHTTSRPRTTPRQIGHESTHDESVTSAHRKTRPLPHTHTHTHTERERERERETDRQRARGPGHERPHARRPGHEHTTYMCACVHIQCACVCVYVCM